jgi:hypothetical protein
MKNVSISGIPVEIRTEHLRNMSLERYRYTNLPGVPVSYLGPENGYPELFRGFSHSFHVKVGIPKIIHHRFLLNPLQLII